MLFSITSAPRLRKAREEAEKLLHLEQPPRTRLWVKMNFMKDVECATSGPLLSRMWYEAWKPYIGLEPAFEEAPFLECLLRTFPEATRVDIDEGHYVICGISPKPNCPSGAEELLERKNCKDYKRLVDSGATSNDAPTSKFVESLRKDPLVPISTKAATGPFLARLRRRQQYLMQTDVTKTHREYIDYYNVCAEIYHGEGALAGKGVLAAKDPPPLDQRFSDVPTTSNVSDAVKTEITKQESNKKELAKKEPAKKDPGKTEATGKDPTKKGPPDPRGSSKKGKEKARA